MSIYISKFVEICTLSFCCFMSSDCIQCEDTFYKISVRTLHYTILLDKQYNK